MAGITFSCIGVGITNPRSAIASSRAFARPVSSNVVIIQCVDTLLPENLFDRQKVLGFLKGSIKRVYIIDLEGMVQGSGLNNWA
jgi:hypothetical protein